MKELLNRLQENVGLSAEQASGAIDTVKDYLKEKFPIMEGIMEKFMGDDDSEGGSSIADKASGLMDGLKEKMGGMGDKAEGLMDGLEDKLEGLGGEAGEKAKDALNKLKDMFGKD